MRTKTLSGLATSTLVACAVLVTGLVVRREFFVTPITGTAPEVAGWRNLANIGWLLGREDAPIKIIEFSDFQCPFCRQAQITLADLRKRYPDRLAIVYRHYPLPGHKHAFAAAVASECAAAQGRFEAYHDLLFAKQDSLGIKSWTSYAGESGLPDLDMFLASLDDERVAAQVQRDVEAAERIGIDGTPSFIVDGKLLSGAPTQVQAESWVRARK